MDSWFTYVTEDERNMNLLDETIDVLLDNGKTVYDVEFVRTNTRCGTWDEFAEIAKDIEYDNGYGNHQIELSLQVCGKGWWLERHEYDGSERWIFQKPPKKWKQAKPLEKNTFFRNGNFEQ
jgi:hypothetical protein